MPLGNGRDGAAKAERADRGHGTQWRRQRLRRDRDRPSLPGEQLVQCWVEHEELSVASGPLRTQMLRLSQTKHARRRLRVAHVRLRGADAQRHSGRVRENVRQRAKLSRVAKGGSSPVGLHASYLFRGDRGAAKGGEKQATLR